MEDILKKYKYVDLHSLGTDGLFKPVTTAQWYCQTKVKGGYSTIITEEIKTDFVGRIYHDLLFEAFIN